MSLKIKNSRVEQSTLSNSEEKPVDIDASLRDCLSSYQNKWYYVEYCFYDDAVSHRRILSYSDLEALVLELDLKDCHFKVIPL